jgi:hypothetical protein
MHADLQDRSGLVEKVALLIVVSGVLVAVALVFLIIGLFQHSGIGFILVSIVTSLVSGVFLLLGALQRRGQPAALADGASTGAEALERVTAVSVRPREDAAAEPAGDAAQAAMVSVVRGRPRYHVESCRFLAGRPDVEQVSVDEARGEGYTACGVCKPDAALEAAAAAPAEEMAEPEAMSDDTALLDTASGMADEDEAAPAPRKTAARTATGTATRTATGTATRTAAKKAPAKTAAAAKPAKKAAATKSTAAAAKPAAGSVVVIPDRGKFHTETCRFVKDVAGTVTLAKTAAKRQGYTACGVCKP